MRSANNDRLTSVWPRGQMHPSVVCISMSITSPRRRRLSRCKSNFAPGPASTVLPRLPSTPRGMRRRRNRFRRHRHGCKRRDRVPRKVLVATGTTGAISKSVGLAGRAAASFWPVRRKQPPTLRQADESPSYPSFAASLSCCFTSGSVFEAHCSSAVLSPFLAYRSSSAVRFSWSRS